MSDHLSGFSLLTQMAIMHRKRFPRIIERFEDGGPFWLSCSHWGLIEMAA